jgi:hypothetical protein
MSLSRKHYCAVAAIIAKVGGDNSQRYAIELADYFTADNPNFDRAQFLAACKVTA